MTELAADAPGGANEPLAGAQHGPDGGPSAVDTDPERALAEFPVRIDEDTLREIVDEEWDLERIRFGLTKKLATAPHNAARARLYGLRAVTSRMLGKLNDALDDAEQALRYAESTGSARRIAVASTRLARVLQWRGDFAVADALYQRALDAAIPDRLRAAIHHYFGTSCYDQGRYVEALQHFDTVLALRPGENPEQAAADQAFAAISQRVSTKGFGPLPRARAEILQETPPPTVRFHEVFRRYGYAGPGGEGVIAPEYQQADPFAGGLAWVQPDTSPAWTLIDTSGEVMITGTDYESVGPFNEGLAWVRSDPVVGWFAIDSRGLMAVPPAGYLDVRPFHGGLAAVSRNGKWGAVDVHGREVVPMEFAAYRTATSDAKYLSGFTGEGLAVVERDDVVGVINRDGDVVVPLAFAQIEIHPVAYLVRPPRNDPDYSNPFRSPVDLPDGWGAMDRGGELVVDTVHSNRAEVLEELEKLLRDAHPIL
ncbi:MAG: WG repeat-containing protein [Micromonosporaceae bacterium]